MVVGPYRAATKHERDAHIRRARNLARKAWAAGLVVICPHTNTCRFDDLEPDIPDRHYLDGYLAVVRRMDYLLTVQGFENSQGTGDELKLGEKLDLPIYHSVEEAVSGEAKLQNP